MQDTPENKGDQPDPHIDISDAATVNDTHASQPPDANDRTIVDKATVADGVFEKATVADGVFDKVTIPEPDRIGSFKVIRKLGAGAMGTVYHAVQDNPQRDVAVKVMKPGTVTRNALSRFQFEAQVLANLNHPIIAQIYEAGTFNDGAGERPYFAMEFISEARELDDWISLKELDLQGKLELFRAICSGVEYGHRHGIIHRDLKPENILVDSTGQPKIIDFGVARSAETDARGTLVTEAGRLIGTLQYMSPEQVELNPDELDTRSDVYSLGLIFYEMICEERPYDLSRQTMHEATRLIIEAVPPPPSTFQRRLRGDLETIALKALEKDRERRYGSAQAFADDIRRYQEHEPIEARPPSISYRFRKIVRKHRTAAVAAMIVLLVIIAGGIISVIGWREADRGWAEAQKQTEVVKEQNVIVSTAMKDLTTGVLEKIEYLGNSASAKRALLEVVLGTANQMNQSGQSPAAVAQRCEVLLLIAHTYLSTSGVGSGNIQEAFALLDQVGEELAGIDSSAILTEDLSHQIQILDFQRIQYLSEAHLETSQQASLDPELKRKSLETAAALHRERARNGKAFQESGGPKIKAIDVQFESVYMLGILLGRLGDPDGALDAFEKAYIHTQTLLDIDPNNRVMRLRDNAITLQGIAKIESRTDPNKSLDKYDTVVDVYESLITLDPSNVRAPRDLAIALSRRGKLKLQIDQLESGVRDIEDAADLFIQRAVISGQEPVAQRELKDWLLHFTNIFDDTPYAPRMRIMLESAIDQLQYVAETGRKSGDTTWTTILRTLDERAKQLPSSAQEDPS